MTIMGALLSVVGVGGFLLLAVLGWCIVDFVVIVLGKFSDADGSRLLTS